MEAADRLELVLREPIVLGTLETTELVLTEPTGDQLVASYKQALPLESLMTLIAMNAGVSPAIVKKMRQRDLQRADAFFSAFGLPSSSPSSETTPQS
jgi:hypothetical protein